MPGVLISLLDYWLLSYTLRLSGKAVCILPGNCSSLRLEEKVSVCRTDRVVALDEVMVKPRI